MHRYRISTLGAYELISTVVVSRQAANHRFDTAQTTVLSFAVLRKRSKDDTI